jgi:proteasome lid subunit RPN8/RPN11
MTLVLEPRHVDAIRRHGEADYPREACGLIGGTAEDGRKVAVTIVPLRNGRDDTPNNRYLIDPDAFRHAQDRLDQDGLEVIGVYHSHPDHPPAPSVYDREHAWPWFSYVIVEIRRGRAGDHQSWVLADDRQAFVLEEVWQSPS